MPIFPTDTRLIHPITVAVPDPPLSGNLAYAPGNHLMIKLVSLHFLLTTSAIAASRQVIVAGFTNPNHYHPTPATISQPANNAYAYVFNLNQHEHATLLANATVYQSLPQDFFISDIDLLVTNIVNIQVGDQISDVVVRFLQWIAPNW